jgi:hypothetical protein
MYLSKYLEKKQEKPNQQNLITVTTILKETKKIFSASNQ